MSEKVEWIARKKGIDPQPKHKNLIGQTLTREYYIEITHTVFENKYIKKNNVFARDRTGDLLCVRQM